jgi:hypothetical protein
VPVKAGAYGAEAMQRIFGKQEPATAIAPRRYDFAASINNEGDTLQSIATDSLLQWRSERKCEEAYKAS